MNGIIKEEIEDYLNSKRVIEKTLISLCKKEAVISQNIYFLSRIDNFYEPKFVFHSDEPDWVNLDEVGVYWEIYEYGSPDSTVFNFPLSALWESEDWDEDLQYQYDQIILNEQRKRQEKAEALLGTQEARERETLAHLKEKYPD